MQGTAKEVDREDLLMTNPLPRDRERRDTRRNPMDHPMTPTTMTETGEEVEAGAEVEGRRARRTTRTTRRVPDIRDRSVLLQGRGLSATADDGK